MVSSVSTFLFLSIALLPFISSFVVGKLGSSNETELGKLSKTMGLHLKTRLMFDLLCALSFFALVAVPFFWLVKVFFVEQGNIWILVVTTSIYILSANFHLALFWYSLGYFGLIILFCG